MNSSSSPDTQMTRAPYPPPGLSDGAWTMARPSPARRPHHDDDAGQATPIQRMHRLLRGRYAIAFTLAALLATALAAAGYLLPKPVYKSNGIIEIKPNIASLTDTATVMPLYTQYVEQQVQVMGTERVITSAMESDEWKPYSKGMSPKAMKDFVDHLEVEYVRGTFAIRVSYADPDPSRAQAAVKSVIRAYLQTSADVETQDLRTKLQLVANTRDALARTKKDLEQKRVDAARQYGTTDLSELHNARVKQMITLESQLTQANIQLAAYKAALNGGNAAATQPAEAMNA
jgi:uncharacterized protein involved in exopolysaccharide biosynthesis